MKWSVAYPVGVTLHFFDNNHLIKRMLSHNNTFFHRIFMVMLIFMAQNLFSPCQAKKVNYHGLHVRPHSSTNMKELKRQYNKNREQWDKMFEWLSQHDLLAMEKGKYPIEGTSLIVSIEDSFNQPLEKRRSESHYHHIDFQWVVSGVERFALLDHATSRPNCEWKEDVIRYDYDVEKTTFIDSSPDHFFLFFPSDWHIAKIESPSSSDQKIRVVVVKLDYVE